VQRSLARRPLGNRSNGREADATVELSAVLQACFRALRSPMPRVSFRPELLRSRFRSATTPLLRTFANIRVPSHARTRAGHGQLGQLPEGPS
jgi:hypothetical protein